MHRVRLAIALGLLAIAAPARADLLDPLFTETIKAVSAREGVDPRLVHAVIRVESAYQPQARSPKGAMGLMQLMPETARQYSVTNAYDPVANIEAGVKHLRSLLARLPVELALAAYNAGEAAVERFNGIPPYRETQDYVARVMGILRGDDNYRPPAYRLVSTRPAARRFAFAKTSTSAQTGSPLPLRAARSPWRQGQAVRAAFRPAATR